MTPFEHGERAGRGIRLAVLVGMAVLNELAHIIKERRARR